MACGCNLAELPAVRATLRGCDELPTNRADRRHPGRNFATGGKSDSAAGARAGTARSLSVAATAPSSTNGDAASGEAGPRGSTRPRHARFSNNSRSCPRNSDARSVCRRTNPYRSRSASLSKRTNRMSRDATRWPSSRTSARWARISSTHAENGSTDCVGMLPNPTLSPAMTSREKYDSEGFATVSRPRSSTRRTDARGAPARGRVPRPPSSVPLAPTRSGIAGGALPRKPHSIVTRTRARRRSRGSSSVRSRGGVPAAAP